MDKPIHMSKTIWAGGLLVLLGIYEYYTGDLASIAGLLEKLFMGLGLIGLRQAV